MYINIDIPDFETVELKKIAVQQSALCDIFDVDFILKKINRPFDEIIDTDYHVKLLIMYFMEKHWLVKHYFANM